MGLIGIMELQEEVNRLGAKIEAPRSLLIVRSTPSSDGAPYVEISSDTYYFVSSERGLENFRHACKTSDELIYRIMKEVTSKMALAFELERRVQGKDWRRIYFSRRARLMTELDLGWGERDAREIEEILSSAPFVD